MASSTDEIFEEFYETIKSSVCVDDVCAEWGGISIAVPAFVGEKRDRKIYEDYKEFGSTMAEGRKYVALARKYNLGTRKIQEVIRAYKGEVGLFNNTEEK